MSIEQIRSAAHAVVNGGIGFVPMPSGCKRAAQEALRTLIKLGEYRKSRGHSWEDAKWGYALDDRKQYDRGLSQWRPDERKDVFHFDPTCPSTLEEQGAVTEDWQHFFKPCAEIHRQMSVLGLQCAEQFDHVLPGFGFADSCESAQLMDVVRLLAYERRLTANEVAAKPHRDRDFLSIHVHETAPGLFIGHDEQTRIRISIPPGHAAIFAGRKFEQMTGGEVKALWHGTCEVPALEPHGRRSVVFFKHTGVALIRDAGELEAAA